MNTDDTVKVKSPRRWSARALPSCMLALAMLALSAVVLIDIVRMLDHHRHSWLVAGNPALDWLAELRFEQLPALLISGGLVVLGMWCVLSALLPGARDRLPMRSGDALCVGYVSGSSAKAALRESALRVENIVWARVRLGRRKAKVKVRIAAGDRAQFDDVRTRVHDAVQRRFDSFGLVRPRTLAFATTRFKPRAVPETSKKQAQTTAPTDTAAVPEANPAAAPVTVDNGAGT